MTTLLTRDQWIAACHFHDLSEREVLREIGRRVGNARDRAAEGHHLAHPLVLLDLDSTLYEVGPRTHQILLEWTETQNARSFGLARDRIAEVARHHVGYSLKDTFDALGLDAQDKNVQAALKDAKQFWTDRFFTSEYLKFDHAYAGASHFAQEVHELGAEIIYLTGRDEPNMGEGTRAKLIEDRFPWKDQSRELVGGPRTHLLMKPHISMDDLEFKQSAAHYIKQHGTLIASFENEPPNLVALRDLFPDSMHVFMDTVCSDRPAPVRKDLYRIKGFSAR